MMEPCARPGEAAPQPAPNLHSSLHEDAPMTAYHEIHHNHTDYGKSKFCNDRSEPGLHPLGRPVMSPPRNLSNPAPSQVLEQLAQSLQSQSLAVKRRSEWSSYHNLTDEVLEVDSEAEDVLEDPFVLSQTLSALYHRKRYARTDNLANELTRSEYLLSTTSHAPNRPRVDSILDREGSDNVARHIPTLPHGHASTIAADDSDDSLEPPLTLSFRRSAHAAVRNPYVVQKATRMRKRTRRDSQARRLPQKGEKGKSVVGELDSSTCLDK